MPNYLFKLRIVIRDLANIENHIIIPAKNKTEAERKARYTAIGWWGIPESMNGRNVAWVLHREEPYVSINAVPEFKNILTYEQTNMFIEKGVAQLVKCTEVSDERIINELEEAVDCGLELDSGMLVTLFGESLAARAILELSSKGD